MKKTVIAFIIGITLFNIPVFLPESFAQETSFSEREKSEIESIVRDYILAHPEIIPEAIRILQEKQNALRAMNAQEAIQTLRGQIENDGYSPVLGNPNGDVTIVEFYDYRCPFCVRIHPVIKRILAEDPNVRLVMKQFPIKDNPGTPAVSLTAARIAMAADKQGKFPEFHEAAMATNVGLTIEGLYSIAADIGLDMVTLTNDVEQTEMTDNIRTTFGVARELAIDATPTFIIGDRKIVGAQGYDALKAAINEARTGIRAGVRD